jgi:hypothetical protein
VGVVNYCWNRCSSNFIFPMKFVIVLLCSLLVDNNTFLKCLTGYTDDDGYEKQNVNVVVIIIIIIIIIIESKAMKSLCQLF